MIFFSRLLRTSVFYVWAFCLFTFILILLGTHNVLFSICAIAISFVYIVWAKNNQEFILMAFLFPLATLFKPYAEGTSFYTIALLICTAKYLLQGVSISKELYFFVFFVFFEQLVFFDVDFLKSIKLCGGLVFVLYGLNKLSEMQSEQCFWAFSLGFLLSSICPFLNSNYFRINEYSTRVSTLGGTHGDNTIYRFVGLSGDPNYYSVNLMIVLVLMIVLYYNNRIKFPLLMIIFFICGYFTVITYSKSSFLMFFYPIVLLFWTCLVKRKVGIMAIMSAIVAVFSSYVAVGKIQFLNIILNRFSRTDSASDFTTGRWDIWMSYLDFFNDNIIKFFLGSGISAPLINNAQAHNTFIEILYTCGILGFTLFIFAIKGIFKSNKLQNKSKVLMNFSILICLSFMYFFLSEFLAYDLTWHMLLAGLVYKLNLIDREAIYVV